MKKGGEKSVILDMRNHSFLTACHNLATTYKRIVSVLKYLMSFDELMKHPVIPR